MLRFRTRLFIFLATLIILAVALLVAGVILTLHML